MKIECKADRADFLREVNKQHDSSIGTFRYILVNPGVCSPEEACRRHSKWGLLRAVIDESERPYVSEVMPAVRFASCNSWAELKILRAWCLQQRDFQPQEKKRNVPDWMKRLVEKVQGAGVIQARYALDTIGAPTSKSVPKLIDEIRAAVDAELIDISYDGVTPEILRAA